MINQVVLLPEQQIGSRKSFIRLESDELVKLDFDPELKALRFSWQELESAELSVILEAFQHIRTTLMFYSIKNLLIDASQCSPEAGKTSFHLVKRYFHYIMAGTPLQKVARVSSLWQEIEDKVALESELIRESIVFILQFRNFDTEAEALKWIRKKE